MMESGAPKWTWAKIEGASREEFEEFQLIRLKRQIDFLYHTNPFYQKRMNEVGVSPKMIKRLEDIQILPFSTKADFLKDQEEYPPYGLRLGVPIEKIVRTVLTSGTSGLGQEVYGVTNLDAEEMAFSWAFPLQRYGIKKGDVGFMDWPIGTAGGPISLFLAFSKMGVNSLSLSTVDSKTKLKYMKRFFPACFMSTPAYLTHLTGLCLEMGIDPKKEFKSLKFILVGTEAFPVVWAQRMQEFWGLTIHDCCGLTQAGASTAMATCERGAIPEGKRGVMHLHEFAHLFEVLDPKTGKPVGSGEEGELVVTNLCREASPVVRFKTSDRVTWISHLDCPCGRGLNGIQSGTIARYDSMIKIKGLNVWPDAIDTLVFENSEIDEYNGSVEVDKQGRERVTVSVEFKPYLNTSKDNRERFLRSLSQAIQQKTGIHMEVKEVSQGTLKRFLMKSQRWSDERQKGLEKITCKI